MSPTSSAWRKALLCLLAVLCLGACVILLPLPIPLGLPLIFAGVAILLSVSHVAQGLLRRCRRRWPRLDAAVRGAQERVPGALRDLLTSTDPLRGD